MIDEAFTGVQRDEERFRRLTTQQNDAVVAFLNYILASRQRR